MQMKAGMALKPSDDLGMFVSGVVVANDVKLELGGDLLIDLAQESQPLLMAMARGRCGQTPCQKGSPGRQRGLPFGVGSSHGSGSECVPGPKAIRAGCVRGPDPGFFHRCRAPRPDRADRGRGPLFPRTGSSHGGEIHTAHGISRAEEPASFRATHDGPLLGLGCSLLGKT